MPLTESRIASQASRERPPPPRGTASRAAAVATCGRAERSVAARHADDVSLGRCRVMLRLEEALGADRRHGAGAGGGDRRAVRAVLDDDREGTRLEHSAIDP